MAGIKSIDQGAMAAPADFFAQEEGLVIEEIAALESSHSPEEAIHFLTEIVQSQQKQIHSLMITIKQMCEDHSSAQENIIAWTREHTDSIKYLTNFNLGNVEPERGSENWVAPRIIRTNVPQHLEVNAAAIEGQLSSVIAAPAANPTLASSPPRTTLRERASSVSSPAESPAQAMRKRGSVDTLPRTGSVSLKGGSPRAGSRLKAFSMDEGDGFGSAPRGGHDKKELAAIHSQIDDIYTALNRKLDKGDTLHEQELLAKVRAYAERRLLEEHRDLCRVIAATADDLRYHVDRRADDARQSSSGTSRCISCGRVSLPGDSRGGSRKGARRSSPTRLGGGLEQDSLDDGNVHVASISEYDVDDNTRASSVTLPAVRAKAPVALALKMDDVLLDGPEGPRGGYAAVAAADASPKGLPIFRKGFPVAKRNIRLQIAAMNG